METRLAYTVFATYHKEDGRPLYDRTWGRNPNSVTLRVDQKNQVVSTSPQEISEEVINAIMAVAKVCVMNGEIKSPPYTVRDTKYQINEIMKWENY